MIRKLLALSLLFHPGLLSQGSEKPNLLFLSIDDLNDWPAFLRGHPDAKTPNLDRLAARGTVFTDAHCQFPLCGPSRASVMSGLLPSSIGFFTHMKDEQLQDRAHEKGSLLLHEYFAKHGYKTMAVGKICHHHVPDGSVDESGGREPFGPSPKPGLNWKNNKTSTDWGVWPERDEDTADFRSADWALARLAEDHGKPFLLMTGFLRPHVPWFVPQKWFDAQVPLGEITLPPYREDDWDDIPALARKVATEPQYPTTEWAIENDQWQTIVRAYLACVAFVDAQAGRVLDALEASPYRDNTVVCLWSDHGYHLGEKGLFKKVTLWDRSTRVPLVLAGPGIPAGQRCDRIVSLLDLYPTLLELCGLPENETNEGRSLVPLLEQPERSWDRPAVTTLFRRNHAVITEQYRYIRYEDGSEELYDRKEDPNEWTNLAGNVELAGVKDELAHHLPGRL